MFHDEFGYIAVARWLAGPQVPELAGPLYHPGYGFLLTPIVRLAGDPAQQHFLATALNAIMIAGLFILLAHLGRAFGLGRRPQLGVAVAVCLGAGITVYSGMLLPEVLLALLTTAATLLVFRMSERTSAVSAIAAGTACATAYLIHPRGLVFVAAFAVTVLATGQIKTAAPGLVIALVGTGLSALAVERAEDTLYAIVRDVGGPSDLISAGLNHPIILAKAMLGTWWYISASTIGLAVIGLLYGAKGSVQQRSSPTGAASIFVVTAVAASVLLSGLFTTQALSQAGAFRPDVPFYGRYVENWVPVLVVLAGAQLSQLKQNRWNAVLALGLGLSLAAGPLVAGSFDIATRSGPTAIHNISALGWYWFRTNSIDLSGWGWIMGAAVIGLVMLGRRAPAVPLIAMAIWGQLAAHRIITDWASPSGDQWAQRVTLGNAIEPGDPIVYRWDSDVLEIYGLQYWHPELDLDVLGPEAPFPTDGLVLSSSAGPPAPGAEMIAADPNSGQAVWALGDDALQRYGD
jgi:hypothetical protein